MSFNVRERQVLSALKDQYESKGYSFVSYPPREILPAFVENYRPDAVALKESDNIAFEVLDRRTKGGHTRLAPIADRFRNREGWTFVIVYAPDAGDEEGLASLTIEAVERLLLEIEQLIAHRHLAAALLMAWSALEATGRHAAETSSEKVESALASRQLVEFLAGQGWIGQDEAKRLRSLAAKRNALAHGFEAEVSTRDLDDLVQVIVRTAQLDGRPPLQPLGQ